MDDNSSTCPYRTYPDTSFWSRTVSGQNVAILRPIANAPFKITSHMKVSTAGSCFAQHIARHLKAQNYTYFVTEDVPPYIPESVAKRYNYGVFSARFGNVYTARQLLQLFQRAYGEFTPIDDVWTSGRGFVDPLRPFIQPGGFLSREALELDRRQHLAAVRRMFEQSDVFVFTLGLTEAWLDNPHGAVFPVCPGCSAGIFDPTRHVFQNFDYEEVLADVMTFLHQIRIINSSIKIILTVSPVPLVATATSEHVLSATIYSKSVLRAVAGKIAKNVEGVAYFPSYEIISGPPARGRYFGNDLRSVTEEGVNHVMRVFFDVFSD